MTRTYTFLLLVAMLSVLAGCNFEGTTNPTPTADDSIIEQPINPLPQVTNTQPATATPQATVDSTTPTSTPSVTVTPSPQPSVVVGQAATLTPTSVPQSIPAELPTGLPSPTPSIIEYEIQQGDTLTIIVGREPFNYTTTSIFDVIIRMNDNLFSADVLPPVGETIRIPLPTLTPTNAPATAVNSNIGDNNGPTTRDTVNLPSDVVIGQHIVEEGESAISIVLRYDMTLGQLSQINNEVQFPGCNFELPSGGPNCAPVINEGQEVNVFLPPPTVTPTPSPSGNETATPTPTYAAPIVVSPPEGALATGAMSLSWVSVGRLKRDEYYLVTVTNSDAGSIWNGATSNTYINLPADLIPPAGETHQIEWEVTVARRGDEGTFVPVGAIGRVNSFRWAG